MAVKITEATGPSEDVAGALDFVLTFREPVTLRMARSAAALLKVDLDDMLEDFSVPLDGAIRLADLQRFCDLVLVEGPDLESLPMDQAETLAAAVAADFFTEIWQRKYKTQIGILLNSTSGPESRVGREAPRRASSAP